MYDKTGSEIMPVKQIRMVFEDNYKDGTWG